jgi:tetratricopeptide (TPR) repeat protein
MSELWLCREKKADIPYYLETEGVNIYTIEELCYFLYHNLYLLNDNILNTQLYNWLSQELHLPRLAAALSDGQKQGQNVLWCALLILTEGGIYTTAELFEFRALCLEMGNKSEFECGKIRADHLLRNGRYLNSIREYHKLLLLDLAEGSYPILVGDIWHNMAIAYAGLFLFHEAANYFRKAYKYNQKAESKKAYQTALDLSNGLILEDNTGQDLTDLTSIAAYLMQQKNEYKKKVMEHGTV